MSRMFITVRRLRSDCCPVEESVGAPPRGLMKIMVKRFFMLFTHASIPPSTRSCMFSSSPGPARMKVSIPYKRIEKKFDNKYNQLCTSMTRLKGIYKLIKLLDHECLSTSKDK